ncbi:GT-D fold domain-containing glycosyltransferase [Paenibacillus sp. GM2]|uniref:GT-D fold domain-containing protein n=1 Tax=Paenibacillus sp. GM2 TaxID=1622070 RepID=UPI001E503B3E|nr:GT-D fold domain-containing glycosyltransferase [Paenibacillus sp. GM2]
MNKMPGKHGDKVLGGTLPAPIAETDVAVEEQGISKPAETPMQVSVPPNQSRTRQKIETLPYEEGYRQGLYDGGEAKVEKWIPHQMVLPELTVDDVIQVGVQSLTASLIPILTTSDVSHELEEALKSGRPFSLVRLGDGELLTLAYDTVMSGEEVRRWGSFLSYAGVNLPDSHVRLALAEAISSASIVGIPKSRHPSYQGLLFPVLRHFGIDYGSLKLTSSTINYALNEEGELRQLLTGRKVLLIGNETPGLAKHLQSLGIQVRGIIAPVLGVSDVQRVMNQIAHIDFDIAFVAAGVAAVILCARIANELGKAALDMGHLANKITSGEMSIT